jgi:hypothetical protein
LASIGDGKDNTSLGLPFPSLPYFPQNPCSRLDYWIDLPLVPKR